MEKLTNHFNWKLAGVIFLGTAYFLLVGCSKQMNADDAIPKKTKISVRVDGIDESIKNAQGEAKASAASKEVSAKEVAELHFAGFDASLSVDHELGTAGGRKMIKSSSRKGASKQVMGAAMDPGVKYRLYLYKADNSFVSSTELTSDVPAEIEVDQGVDYKWYALSYNNSESPVDINPATPTVTSLSLPANKDILYDAGTFSVPTGPTPIDVPVSIVFDHMVSRIGIELNTMGMFADMASAVVSVTGLSTYSGTFDLASGTWGTLTAAANGIDWADFVNIEEPYADRKIAYVYTPNTAAINNLTVTMTDLSLNLDDNTVRSFSALLAATPSVFTFNVSPVVANDHRLLVNLIESPLTVGGVRWGRANLYYQGGHNPYRFHHTYAHSSERNTFFSFKGLVPQSFGVNGDPCAEVYPAGKWRMPTNNDLMALTGTPPLYLNGQANTTGATGGLGYLEYTNATGTAAPYPSNDLHFNYNGGSLSVGLVGGLLQVTFGNLGITGEYWSSTNGTNILGLVGLGGYSLLMTNTLGDMMEAELLNVQTLGVDVIESPFKNVRCVRAN